jgi:ribose transport system permease protein
VLTETPPLSSQSAAGEGEAPRPSVKTLATRALLSADVGLLLVLALFCVSFALFTRGFTSPFNLFALSRAGTVNILVGLSMMTVIVTGGLDLSVGAIGVAASMGAGWLMQDVHLPLAAGLIFALALGGAMGFINGQLIVRSGMHSFVVTLATMSVFFGAMIVLTRAQPYNALPDGFAGFARIQWWHVITPMLLVALTAAVLLYLLYRFTETGRNMLAAGANPRAALLSGVNVPRTIVLCHSLAGLLAAVAGLMLSMRNAATIPAMAGNLGQDWLLPAFLGPVLGGALLSGGRVSVPGAVLGSLLVTVLGSGLLLLHVGEFWVQFFLGVLLLGAVLVDKMRQRVALGLR